uniref:Uncharacterized protein n=1 Tax=OCS116 cluster bacterium TaxID=2030921 RepID=A0A2A4YXD9_9PROT
MHNVVDWGGESARDQRLSGLASLRRQAPAGATSPPIGGRKDADFQSINYQPTVFLQYMRGSAPADALEVCIYYVRAAYRPTLCWHCVRSLRSLATPNGDARSRLSHLRFELFSHDRQYRTRQKILSLQWGTEAQSFAKLQLTKHNAVRLGGEIAPDQRLSDLARERSERTQCPT